MNGFSFHSMTVCAALIAVCAVSVPPVPAAEPVPVNGEISAGGDSLVPIAQDGNLITFLHVDVHEFSGDLDGLIHIVELITVDVVTGDGCITGEGTFVGTVNGSVPGSLRMKYHGDLRSFAFVENGHLIMSQGRDGLTGIHVNVAWDFAAGVGGAYAGFAIRDNRS